MIEIFSYGHKQVLKLLPNQNFIFKGSKWSNSGHFEPQKESRSSQWYFKKNEQVKTKASPYRKILAS